MLKSFKIYSDERGSLVAIEALKDVPFEIKRIFYISDMTSDKSRGNHAHYNIKQYIVAIKGSCKITLEDREGRKTYELKERNIGLFQDAMVWGVMHDFSEDCILMVLASEYYNESDYIYDYDKFMQIKKIGNY